MTIFDQIAVKIIREQELIIGPVAWQQAGKVGGMRVDPGAGTVAIEAPNPSMTIDQLVSEYEHLFGRASREASKDAVMSLIAELPPTDVPASLR